MGQFLFLVAGIGVFIGTLAVEYLKSRESALPAIRGTGGELLMRGKTAALADASLAVLAVPFLLGFHLIQVGSAPPLFTGVALAVVVISSVLHLARRFERALRERFVITREGVTWVRGWSSRRTHLNWDSILEVRAEVHGQWYRHGDIKEISLRGAGVALIKVPLGMVGYYELLEAIETHVPQARWHTSFTPLGESATRRRELMETLRPSRALPSSKDHPWS